MAAPELLPGKMAVLAGHTPPVPRPGTMWPPVHDGLAPPPPWEPGLMCSSAVLVPSASPPQPWHPQGCHLVLLLLPCSGARAPPCSKAAAVPGTPRLVLQRQPEHSRGACQQLQSQAVPSRPLGGRAPASPQGHLAADTKSPVPPSELHPGYQAILAARGAPAGAPDRHGPPQGKPSS